MKLYESEIVMLTAGGMSSLYLLIHVLTEQGPLVLSALMASLVVGFALMGEVE